MTWTRLGRGAALAVTGLLLMGACAADDTADEDDGQSDETTDSNEAAPTGPAPGVTDDTIKVGVTYVDTEALVASGLNYDLGPHEDVYDALFDAINAEGGIHGRMIEPVYAPINPTQTAPAEEACVKLTEDDDVFVVMGFFLNDAVMCPLQAHETAVVGGGMTPERLEVAAAPWVTWLPDSDQPVAIVEALHERGELDGTVGVYSATRDQALMEDTVIPALEDLGVEIAETGVMDAPPDDPTAVQASVEVIAERFDAAGVDTVVLVGASGQDWPTAMEDNADYRPKLLFLEQTGARAFYTNAATTDTSVLEGAFVGGGYGPDQARWEAQEDCNATIADAGIEVTAPEDSGDDPSIQPYQSLFQACPDVALLAAVLEAAGEDLNYGTFEAAIDGLQVTIPGDPTERTFGPPPDADGSPTAYLYVWDESAKDMVLQED